MKNEIVKLLSGLNNSNKLMSTNIETYVEKIWARSKIIAVMEEGHLQGFISYYNNDKGKKNAFLTMIALDPRSQGTGLGKMLLEASIKDLEKKKFKHYRLEVMKNNSKAQRLYEFLGFQVEDEFDKRILMKLDL